MAAQTNATSQSFGYTWGFADNSRGESVVEISPNINYTSLPYLQLSDGSNIIIQKDPKGTLTHTNKGGVRRMLVVNDPSLLQQGNTQSEGTAITPIFTTNGLIDGKGQTVLTTSSKGTHFMSPLGPIQLTAEECNEILMKRAAAAVAANNQQHTLTTADGHHAISVQVQKVIQGLEDDNDSQTTTHMKIEPSLDISPKIEQIDEIHSDSNQANCTIKKERPYSCEQCGKSFLLKHHLTTHSRVHTGERPHVCTHCGKDFAHKHCLNTHLLLHSTDRPFQCQECKKSFTLKHHLLTHSRVHSRDRPFVCQECGRSFPLKRHLVTHSKFHAGERPFICEVCNESFAQKDHLVMHSRFHGSTNPFVCNDCGLTFARKFQLVNHQKLHGKVPHACTVCGKEFLQKRTLQAHMRMHTGDSPFPCITCGEGFRTKSELNLHNRVAHGNSNSIAQNTTIVPVNTIVSSVQQQQQQQQAQQQAQQSHQIQVQSQQVQHQQQQLQQNHHQQQTVEIQTVQHHSQPQHQTVTVVSGGNPNLIISSPQGQETQTIGPRYACRECGSAFNTKEALALHLRLHTGDKTLMTDLCALTAAIPGHLFQGVVAANNQSSSVPVQLISTTGQVISQATIQNSGQHQQQTIQQVQTQSQPQIKYEHVQVVPQQQQQQTNQVQVQQQQTVVQQIHQAPKPKSHFCGHCGKGFAAKNGLMLHNKRHPNGGCTMRSHVCECGKAFFQKNHLMLHQRQHMDPKSIQQIQQQAQEAIVSQAQQQNQGGQGNGQQQQLTRNLVISNGQPMQVQVLDNNQQVIKYEIIQHESRNSIE